MRCPISELEQSALDYAVALVCEFKGIVWQEYRWERSRPSVIIHDITPLRLFQHVMLGTATDDPEEPYDFAPHETVTNALN